MTDIPLRDVPVEHLRERKLASTAALLGATISITDEQWQQPSLLPGWTRAHVAAHLAQNAQGLARLAENVLTGGDQPMYPADRDDAIERGSELPGLDLQIALDTSAGRLNEVFDRFTPAQWERPVTLPGEMAVPARLLPAARLGEVELHHVDLDIGYTCADIPDDIARWLIQWSLSRYAARGYAPDARVITDDGLVLGTGDTVVRGSRQDVLAWLTGRPQAEPIEVPASFPTPPGV